MVDEVRGVRVPLELHPIPARPVEEYVRARLIQFATPFARRINPSMPQALIQQVAAESMAALPAPEYGPAVVENRDLQLVFRHDCLSLGCLDPQCVLCEHNPHRRCNVNFAPKYLVNDVLKAKCEAPIRVEIIDRATGVPVGDDIQDVHLEMCILDGNAYDAKCLEMGVERDDDLEGCSLVLNNKQTPLLAPGASGTHSDGHKVIVQLTRGMAQLPDLTVSDSSEAMLSGRKPPFRLLVRAVHDEGRRLSIRHAVSEGFVVATRRTRTAGKVEIPNVDDHVSKLEHMGKETVKKLQDIHASAVGCGIDIAVPSNCVNKVGEFRKLALLAEGDGHLRQKLQQVLKLSKEKWDEARDHAMRAVVADNRMRIWYADKGHMEVGLLFTCRLGNVDLERPVGLLQKKSQDGAQTTMEATLMAQQTPQQREQVRILQPQGVASWWQGGHPGWAIYPVDSDHFMSTGALDSVSVANDSLASTPAADSGFPFGRVNGVLPPNSSASFGAGAAFVPGLPADLANLMGPGRIEPLASQPPSAAREQSPLPTRALSLMGGNAGSGDLALKGLASLGNIYQAGSMGSGQLGLGGFQSADLDQLVNAYPSTDGGGGSGNMGAQFSMGSLPSMTLGALDSVDLGTDKGGAPSSAPLDASRAAAMLHDMPGQRGPASSEAPPAASALPSTSGPPITNGGDASGPDGGASDKSG
mmetsp:Transcript_10080/g.30159  ORF Transcript_10080/g.30159 Transcript_10080/m.30159 type:complete len:698 (+) Transcript_10080:368-2461(+)|eukprot:CAMPEP_0206137458 /NCGR_PEP_ID=MMETSP1473-20131121/2576_1 /ASSEMBLY_ACC=CAM_ASM_001109 /TAXON_ID=1461547 /ORGANISM="Stichococcus sp, Strain RCC1054" /LENGTH=697 /DNA_ID=CAMNT_0053530549 /DNA_START=309 /DNA_END=2402 /DNA_ORIENTATION=-